MELRVIQKRPLLIVIIVFCLAVITVDHFVPVFFLRNHYSKHFLQTRAFRYRLTSDYIERTNTILFEAEVDSYFDGESWHKTCGKIRIYLPKSDSIKLHYGDVIESSAEMLAIKNFTGQSFDYKKFMKHKRIYHNVFPKDYEKTGEKQYNYIIYAARTMNKALKNRLFRSNLGKQEAALATGMLLGDKHYIDENVRRSFNVAGLGHLLCVSGLHVGLIIGLFSRLLKNVSCNITYHKFYSAFLILLAFFIAFIVGFTPAALRAAIMFSVFLIDKSFFGRNCDKLNLLALIALVFLFLNPLTLFDISFQLSFLAMAGIYTFYPMFENVFMRSERIKNKEPLLVRLRQNMEMSISSQMYSFPIVAYNFKQVSVYFILSNIIAIPLSGLILGMLLLLLLVADLPFVSDIIAFITNLLLKFLILFSLWVDSLPFSAIRS